MVFLIGRKLEMSQQFKDDGSVVPVTLVKAEPNVVTAVLEKAGGISVQLGIEPKDAKLTKAQAGHLKDLPAVSTMQEFRVDTTELKRGDEVRVEAFEPGMRVDVAGTTKGRGFQGVVKRHGFGGSPATHGHKDQLRMPGSIGSREQAPVIKGKRMGGHMGHAQVTVKNLEVVSVDPENNILAIKGAIPGPRGGLLSIRTREGKHVWQK